MKSKIIFPSVLVCLLLLTGCGAKTTPTTQTNPKGQTTASGIVAPANLLSCPEQYFEKEANGITFKVNCGNEPKGEFCSYYTTEKNGEIKTHNLQFTSECTLCRTHKQKGETFLDNTAGKYVHLGYEKKACTQGMYKGQ
jgi:hypothetical protein